MPTEAQKGGPHILSTTKEIVARYLKKHPLAGVAISSAGMVDPDKEKSFMLAPKFPTMQVPNSKGNWRDLSDPLRDWKWCQLCWSRRGHYRPCKGSNNAVCLTIGTGIGGCLCLMVQVFHGFSNSACEVGYLHLPDGAFQDLASTTALVEACGRTSWRSCGTVEWSPDLQTGNWRR